jgi:uncharacterized protein
MPLQAASVNTCPYPAEAAMLASAYNDCFAAEWLDTDSRLRLAMVVAPQDPHKARDEVLRFGRTRGVVAVWIPLTNILLGNPHFYPIYDAASELGLPVVIHPTGSACNYQGGESYAGGLPATYAERHVGFPQLGIANLPSLIFSGVFDRFPTLRLVFAEFGWTWLPSLLWRMDSTWKAFRSEVPWVKYEPSRYVRERVRFTTQPIDEPVDSSHLMQIVDMIEGKELLLFSSDYPHWDNDDPHLAFRGAEAAFRERVFTQNAIDMFGSRLVD